jgi:hypothetical protein
MYVSMVVSSNLIWGHWKYVCMYDYWVPFPKVSVAQEYTITV